MNSQKNVTSDTNIPIFVINLDESTDRYSRMTERLRRLNLEAERIPAIRGDGLSTAEKKRINPWRPWKYRRTNFEIGCYLSHLTALRTVVERNLSRAIILEDDVTFEEDFAWIASTALKFPDDVEILKLEGISRTHVEAAPIIRLRGRVIAFVANPTFGAAAYLVTLGGARKALERLVIMNGQLDSDLFEYWHTGIFSCDVIPYPAKQDGSPSTIRDRQRRELSPLKRLGMNAFRVPIKRFAKIKRHFAKRKFIALARSLAAAQEIRRDAST